MIAIYYYLVGKNNDSPSVENDYTIKDLVSRVVIRDEFKKCYMVFDSRSEFLEWYDLVPEKNKCCHEVIFGRLPQRLKFDIDAPSHKIDSVCKDTTHIISDTTHIISDTTHIISDTTHIISEDNSHIISEDNSHIISEDNSHSKKIYAMVDLLIEAILDELYISYYGIEDINPTRDDIVVTDSSSPSKFSFHVLVLPYFVADNEEVREFTSRVIERLPQPLRTFIDPSVNKKIQNFRLAGSAKLGTNRYKRATLEIAKVFGTATNISLNQLFITAPDGARILQRVYTDGETSNIHRVAVQNSTIESVLEIAHRKGITIGHSFTEIRGTLLCFIRTEPSYCRICKEIHHKDNSLMLGINDNGTIVEHCRQVRGKGIIVGEIDSLQMQGDKSADFSLTKTTETLKIQDSITKRINAIGDGSVDAHKSLASEFEKLPDCQKTLYSEKSMRTYELVPTLAVLAQMKLGKTKAIRDYINKNFHTDSFERKVIRFVTFRQTFSNSIAKDFPDFELYSNIVGDIDQLRHSRLIVQVESLHRLKMSHCPEPIDLLVLDEAESILAQFNSGLHKHFNAAFAMFQWMLKTARHVVCMDANLGDRTYHTLTRMRPTSLIHFHWNQFKKAVDDKYFFTASKETWLGKLYSTLREDKKIVIPTNSLAEARVYEEAIRREFPKKNVMLYSSESSSSEKTRHFGDVHKYWGTLDVLIFTPTCSAGVSFELDHFDILFGYFCDASCDVETCRQMLGRVRNIRSHEHYICIRAQGATLPITTADISNLVRDKRAGLYRNIGFAALQFEYDMNGEIKFYESNFYHLWLENIKVHNLSRNKFIHRFIDQIADTGAHIAGLNSNCDLDVCAALLASHSEINKDIKKTRHTAIANSKDLLPEEAANVRELIQSQQDVNPALQLAYDKYQLRESYSWHDNNIDANFVSRYLPFPVRRIYRNLCRIAEYSSINESLKNIRHQEGSQYEYIMTTRSEVFNYVSEGKDLLRSKTFYVYQSHFIAIWLLGICGFDCITDIGIFIREELIEARLRNMIPALVIAMDRIVFEFEISMVNLHKLKQENDCTQFLKGILKMINTILRIMYGIQIQRSPQTKDCIDKTYYLNHSATGNLFKFEQNEKYPHIISKLIPRSVENQRVQLFLDHVYYDQEIGDQEIGDQEIGDH